MTIGQPAPFHSDRKSSDTSAQRRRDRRSRQRDAKERRAARERRLLTQSLEARHLMAGPELIGIQPNSGELIRRGTSIENSPVFGTELLTVSPRELTFRFDDASAIDVDSLGDATNPLGISITRAGIDGGFEVASAQADFNTNGAVLLEFRAVAPGVTGNGTIIDLTSADRGAGGQQVLITVDQVPVERSGRTVMVDRVSLNLNSNATRPTTMRDLVLAIRNSSTAAPVNNAARLIEALEIRGDSLTAIGRSVPATGQRITLSGANSTQAATDLGLGNATRVRIVSNVSGAAGKDLRVVVTSRDFNGPADPLVSVVGKTITIQINSNAANRTTVDQFVAALNANPTSSELITVTRERGVGTAPITSFTGTIALTGANDVVVPVGYVGIGNSPNEVVFRFAEPLPDDRYQIEVFGTGARALLNVDGEAFNDGSDFAVQFSLNKAPQVLAVVPEPITRAGDGSFTMEPRIIEVYFTEDIGPSSLIPSLYQLIYTRDTVTNQDDRVITPLQVLPDATNPSKVRLLFQDTLARVPDLNAAGQPILDAQGNQVFIRGSARLKIGSDSTLPLVPGQLSVVTDAGDSFGTSTSINGLTATAGQTSSVRLSGGKIENTTPYGLQFPGGVDYEGVRNIRPDDQQSSDNAIVTESGLWRRPADDEPGITTAYYSFPANLLNATNIATEQQRQRAREVLSLFSEYLGIQFIEIGDLAATGITVPTDGPIYEIGVGDIGTVAGFTSTNFVLRQDSQPSGGTYVDEEGNVQEFLRNQLLLAFDDFDESVDDATTGEVFRAFFSGIGSLLGYGFANHLPQPNTQSTFSTLDPFVGSNPGSVNGLRSINESIFPSPSDVVNGQYLYRPESNDIDMYRFTLAGNGKLTLSTVAERLARSSSLDTVLRLYRENPDGSRVEVASNDDYFSNDSLIEIDVTAGTYYVGVSSTGNDSYDPIITGTGIGGTSQGDYELVVTFARDASRQMTDVTGNVLDGDADGKPGGAFNFWFEPQDADRTLYVDKLGGGNGTGQLGQLQRPYREIDLAINAALARQNSTNPVETIRIIGGGEYQIGRDVFGNELVDGSNLLVPQGVNLVVDAGANFRMSRSRISVGSTSESVDRSNTAIQVLGTPGSAVIFTGLGANPTAGSWGGIDIRGDIDFANEGKINLEESGIFLNHIQYADIKHGGGDLTVDGVPRTVSPIELASVRATVINSRISQSADAAIAATPDTFEETRFDESRFQNEVLPGTNTPAYFTSDVTRIGPHIRGNIVTDNTFNGLQIRVETPTGASLETLTVNARLDDSDIVHILTENLIVVGNPGGVNATLPIPSTLLTRGSAIISGATGSPIAAGSYAYRVTFVDANGFESAPSEASTVITASGAAQGISLSNLPIPPAGDFSGRRLYRAPVTGFDVNNEPIFGEFRRVARLNRSSTSFIDTAAVGTNLLDPAVIADPLQARAGRIDAGLVVDPGVIIKLDGARIDVTFDAHLYAEGTDNEPVIFTSLRDDRFGAGGTFATNRVRQSLARAGDWSGIYVGFGAQASLDHAIIAGGGGASRVEGGFASFNVLEAHQSDLRVTNSRFEANADGRTFINDLNSSNNNPDSLLENRLGRAQNASGTIFVRGSQPIITDNTFLGGSGPVMTFDVNSFTWEEKVDLGRSTGLLDADPMRGNSGPMIARNRIGVSGDNEYLPDAFGQSDPDLVGGLNGMEIRGGTVATEVVWDDTDIVHIVRDLIEVPNQHIYGGLRLESDARGSLVVKFRNQDDLVGDPTFVADVTQRRQAGIVVGGNLISAEDQLLDIRDRVGGSLQVVGMPDFPVILTSLVDDTVGAGFTNDGRSNVDTDNNGVRLDENGDPIFILTSQTNDAGVPVPPLLPLGPEFDRTNRVEVDNGTLIDNDIDPANVGFIETNVLVGGELGAINTTGVAQATQALLLQNYQVVYNTFIDVDRRFINDPDPEPAPIALANASNGAILSGPTLVAPDRVRTTGQYDVLGRQIRWTVETFIVNNRPVIYTTTDFETIDAAGFSAGRIADVNIYSYFDQNIPADAGDRLYRLGLPGEESFRLLTLNDTNNVGFSHGGVYTNDGFNQFNSQYLGWSVDTLNDLILRFENLDNVATVNGNIPGQFQNIPGSLVFDSQTPGTTAIGPGGTPGDIATAHVWRLSGSSDASRTTSFVEWIPSDPSNPFAATLPSPIEGAGTWDGITIREAASDRNVQISGENEPANVGRSDTNAIPSQAQYLGELAPRASAADESRRVGLIVDGEVSRASDIDVYAFIAEAGTQVWIDIDRTNSRLDTIVELIDSNGQTLVLSDDSLTEAQLIEQFLSIDPSSPTAALQRQTLRDQIVRRTGNLGAGFNIDQLLGLGTDIVDSTAALRAFQDQYSTNPKDAGMRIVLPGTTGQRLVYHIRVRSSVSASDKLRDGGRYLTTADSLGRGLTAGAYQLQIRLTEADVFAGTQVRYSDVRFAVNGVQVIGGPISGPLVGDDYDLDTAARNNNTLGSAQRLGLYDSQYGETAAGGVTVNPDGSITVARAGTPLQLDNAAGPLSSDRLAKNISGTLDNASDVDWYEFEIDYKQVSRDDSALFLSTIFDLDYASGLDRAAMSLYLFNSAGELVMLNRSGSSVADDLAANAQSPSSTLSAGSFGTSDPYLGAVELLEGTYFLAVAYRSNEPILLDQFTNPNSASPLLRLAPAESVRRIAEERFSSGVDLYPGTAALPEIPLLFDSTSIRDYSLDDVILYVNTATGVSLVNPFTGAAYGTIGTFTNQSQIRDVAFTANGELFGWTIGTNDNNFNYVRIDSSNAAITALNPGGGLQTFNDQAIEANGDPAAQILDVASNTGIQVEAITIRARGVGTFAEAGFLVGNRTGNVNGTEYSTNVLYEFAVRDNPVLGLDVGDIIGPAYNRELADSGAGTSPREIGQINTDVTTTLNNRLGLIDATVVNGAGVRVPALFDGDTFIVSNGTEQVTFELNQGLTAIVSSIAAVTDGQRLQITLPPSISATPLIFEFDNNAATTIDLSVPSNGVIPFDATITETQLAQRIADAIRARVVAPPGTDPNNLLTPVYNNGIELSVFGATGMTLIDSPTGPAGGIVIDGTAVPPPENRLIELRPTDTAASLAIRIQQAITAAQLDGSLPNVTATIEGNSIRLSGIIVGQPTRSIPTGLAPAQIGPRGLIASGLANGGLITGIELLNGNLYAVSNTGGLYVVSGASLNTNVTDNVGTFVATATDLAGLNFTGLRAGPFSVAGGRYSDLLFGTTANGNIYAFNTLGQLQPVFSGGRSFISTGITGIQGLDFSTLDYNLWHVGDNGDAAGAPGHGYDPLVNNSHEDQGPTNSIIFNYNSGVFGNRYGIGEDPVQFNALGQITNPRLDGQIVQDTYNLPGGARGTVQSNPFSLAKISAADQPALYFNYFLETDTPENRDVLNVYVVDSRGVEHLAATNNVPLAGGVNPNPVSATSPTVVDIQPLFDQPTDNVDPTVVQNWRQARVDLGPFAGQSNLSLRFEFSTSGNTLTQTNELRVIGGNELTDNAQIIVNGQAFVLDLNPAIQFPSGAQLASATATGNAATFAIDGQTYVLLTSPTRVAAPGELGIDLLSGANAGRTLSSLSAAEVASAVRTALNASIAITRLVPSGAELELLYVDPNARSLVFFNGQQYLLDRVLDGVSDRIIGPNEDIVRIDLVGEYNRLNPTAPKTFVDLTTADVASVVADTIGEADLAVEASQLVPSNLALQRLYIDPTARFTIVIDGTTYVLNDGARTIAMGEVSVDVTPLDTANYGVALAAAVGSTAGAIVPPSATVSGFNFSDPSDPVDPFGNPNPASSQRNDFFFDATPLPFTGIDTLITGRGAIGTAGNPFSADVDLSSIDLSAGSQLVIDTAVLNVPGTMVIRVFGPDGQELAESAAAIGSTTGQLRVTAPSSGRYIIGFSATGNDSYGEFGGQTNGDFVAVFDVNLQIIVPSGTANVSPLLELQWGQVISVAPGFGLSVQRDAVPAGTPTPIRIPVRPTDSPVAVAAAVRQTLADTFFAGNLTLIPQVGSLLRMDRLPVTNAGPFRLQTTPTNGRVGDAFASTTVGGAADNEFEGVYIDDIIIGFAERGESVTGARALALDEQFVNGSVNQPSVNPIGAYNLEIRDASEYIQRTRFEADGDLREGVIDGRFRTFGTNERLSEGITLKTLPAAAIGDGASFTIADADTRVTFEFDVLDSNGVSNGFVAGENRVIIQIAAGDTDAIVADKIITRINSAPIQALLSVRAGRANGTGLAATSTVADCFINLYGDVSVRVNTPDRPVFADIVQQDLRGDTNRDSGQQGVIMIENNRFLFSSDAGVDINRDASNRVVGRDLADETPTILRYARNLIELNTENLIPGVSVRNNVFAFNADAGVRITGLEGGGNAQENPVGFDRIINNTIIGGTIAPGVDLGPQVFGSVLFEKGAISFADSVVLDTLQLGPDVSTPFSDPNTATGAPDADGQTHALCTLSLGSGGRATFRFEDNLLVGDGTSAPDLVIYETGGIGDAGDERVGVEVSRDGVTFISVGQVFGRGNTVDLDAFGFGPNDQFAFVRLTDLSPAGTFNFGSAGADIDAVGAISTVPRESYTPGSQGIFVHQNSAPTLLNNIVANLQTGIAVVPPRGTAIDVSRDLTVIGGTTYFRNSINARGVDIQSLGAFPQQVSPFEQIFVDPTRLIFTPQSGTVTIDSAIQSLPERGSLQAVKQAVGLSLSPIVTPRLDLNGQFRVDTPGFESPSGLGGNAFVDRGAEDRRDNDGPRAVLVAPRGDDLFIESGRAISRGTIFDAFEIQLVDGIAPAESAPGVGIDDGSVRPELIRLTRLINNNDGTDRVEVLEQGVDYRFAYEPGDNLIRLTPIAGIWTDNTVYKIELLGNVLSENATQVVSVLRAQEGRFYGDGALTFIGDQATLEAETGILLSIVADDLVRINPLTGLTESNLDAQTVTVFDGVNTVTFEFDTEPIPNSDPENTAIRLPGNTTAERITELLAAAINNSPLQLIAIHLRNPGTTGRLQLLGTSPVSVASFVEFSDETFFRQVNRTFDVTLAIDVLDDGTGNIQTNFDGALVTIFDGTQELTFEFDSDNVLSGLQDVVVTVRPDSTPREIANLLIQAITQSGLDVQASAASGTFRITGTNAPISVTSSTGSALVIGNSAIGVSPGYGLVIPTERGNVSPFVQEGQTFSITRLGAAPIRFELDSDGEAIAEQSILVPFDPFASFGDQGPDALANAIVTAINTNVPGLTARNAGNGFVLLDNNELYSLNMGGTALYQTGFLGRPASTPVVIPIDGVRQSTRETLAVKYGTANSIVTTLSRTETGERLIAALYSEALTSAGVANEQPDNRVLIRGISNVQGQSVITDRVQDEVGNRLLAGEVTIFIGGTFDFGDAPGFQNGILNDGPRHQIVSDLYLGRGVNADADGVSDDSDRLDDGVRPLGAIRPGFTTTFEVGINLTSTGTPLPAAQNFYLDAWFDWDRDGRFENNPDELQRFNSVDFSPFEIGVGLNTTVPIRVPEGTAVGDVPARFRLSYESTLATDASRGPVGVSTSGEVEDYVFVVTNNQFQSSRDRWDVNNSGTVTPLDALLVINMLSRYGGSVNLATPPTDISFANFFPDVSGDGFVTARDALQVINRLNELANGPIGSEPVSRLGGESVASTGVYAPVASGVLASSLTIATTPIPEDGVTNVVATPVDSVPSKTVAASGSVFDSAAVMAIDDIVDSLAADHQDAKEAASSSAIDEWFAAMA